MTEHFATLYLLFLFVWACWLIGREIAKDRRKERNERIKAEVRRGWRE